MNPVTVEILHKSDKMLGDKQLIKRLLGEICGVYKDYFNVSDDPYVTLMSIVPPKVAKNISTLIDAVIKKKNNEYIPLPRTEAYIDAVIDLYNWMTSDCNYFSVWTKAIGVCLDILKSSNKAAVLIGDFNSLNHRKKYIIGKRVMLLDDKCKIVTVDCWGESHVGILKNTISSGGVLKIDWIPLNTKIRVL